MGAMSLYQATHTSPEFVDLISIAAVEICCSNGFPDRFCSVKLDKIANESRIHRIDQPPFDNDIIGTLFSKGLICMWWWGIVAVDIDEFIFIGDVHFDNLGPKRAVGTIQLDVDWSCQVFSD